MEVMTVVFRMPLLSNYGLAYSTIHMPIKPSQSCLKMS